MATEKIMSLTWDYSKLFEGLDRYAENVKESFERSARLVAMDGLGRMVAAAPIQTGFLRGSGSAHVNGSYVGCGGDVGATNLGSPKISGTSSPKISTVIVWGFNTFYAAKVHENPNAGARGGGPKYVEKTIAMNWEKWMKFFADNLNRDGVGGAK